MEEPTSVPPPQLKQMSTMFRILLANRNKQKNILEINKEVEADTQNNCVKSCHIVLLNSFKDTFLWLLSSHRQCFMLLWGQTVSLPIHHAKGKQGEMDYRDYRCLWSNTPLNRGKRPPRWWIPSPRFKPENNLGGIIPFGVWMEEPKFNTARTLLMARAPPRAWALCEEPCWCTPRMGWRHFSNGEIVLYAKCYHIANSPAEVAKVNVFFLKVQALQ